MRVFCSGLSITIVALPFAGATSIHSSQWIRLRVFKRFVMRAPLGFAAFWAAVMFTLAFSAPPALAAPSAYAAPDGTSSVTVIAMATNTVVATITVGSFALGPAVTPDGLRLYVTDYFAETISVIDTISNCVSAAFQVPSGVYKIAIIRMDSAPT